MKTMIIAEAGVNHNGQIEMAKQLIDVAAHSGADWVKFQTFKADTLVAPTTPKADYQKNHPDDIQSQWAMLKALELSVSDHQELKAHCSQQGIGFLSTGFDIDSLNFLQTLDMPLIKVPSGEITNLPYLRHVGALDRKVLISTGMATLSEVEAALRILTDSGTSIESITVLHCTSSYPTAMADVNLKAMVNMGRSLGVKVGYSDHTLGIEVAIAAVALGACVIEKHFTLSRGLPGPDHQASLEPEELKAMVEAIKNIEQALGHGEKKPTHAELANLGIARKSLVAIRSIAKGESFSTDNLQPMRPGTGVSPMKWDDFVGRPAQRAYQAGELIEP